MRTLVVFGSLLLVSLTTRSLALPCDQGPNKETDEQPVIQTPTDQTPPGPRTEVNTNVSRNSSQINTTSKTKATQKVKTRARKDGSTVMVIVDKSRSKNRTDAVSDSYDQNNRTVTAGGVEDHTSLTKEKQQHLKEVSVAKNVSRQKIVTDKNGNVVSNTVKAKTSEKDRKSEKTKESEQLIHTVKQVTTEAPDPGVTLPPTPPCDTTTTTEPPRPPCDTTTTTEPPRPPCDTTTTTEPPRPPCRCRTTTTTEVPEPTCGCAV